jgi:hypothetical protein
MRTFVFGRTIRTSSSKEEANECMVSTCAYACAMRPRPAGDACDARLTEHSSERHVTEYLHSLVQRSSIVAVVNLFIVAFFVTANARGQ